MAECQGVGTVRAMSEDFVAGLTDVDLQLILSPDDVQLLFRRAFELESGGRTEDAKAAYHDLLRRMPGHAEALNNLGRLLHKDGAKRSARLIFERLVLAEPERASAHTNLGIILLETDELADSRYHLELALELDPHDTLAHLGLSRLFAIQGDEAPALAHQRAALQGTATQVNASGAGAERAPRLLLLASETQLGAVAVEHLAEATFAMARLFVERVDETVELPAHHAVFNTITDADRNAGALTLARRIAQRSSRPVINSPDAVLQTSRTLLEQRLAGIENVVVPRATLRAPAEVEREAHGFGWPLLLRAPGYHSGQHFLKVDASTALADALAALPGDDLLVIQFLDTRNSDGKFRKYRAMFIDGAIYPAHLAVSLDWKVHFFSADMAACDEHRAEDARYLSDPEEVLGTAALRALQAIAARLQLDYGGIDFAVDGLGRVVVFEANATMTVPSPPGGALWDYRRTPIRRILDATRKMLLNRARAGGWL